MGKDRISSSLLIPSTIGGIEVKIIGDKAFADCLSLESVVIPESVTHIGNAVFASFGGEIEIEYKGSMEKWDKVAKGMNWRNERSAQSIRCSDGLCQIEALSEDGTYKLNLRIIPHARRWKNEET